MKSKEKVGIRYMITSAHASGLNWRAESVTERFISILPTVKETRFFPTISGVSDSLSVLLRRQPIKNII